MYEKVVTTVEEFVENGTVYVPSSKSAVTCIVCEMQIKNATIQKLKSHLASKNHEFLILNQNTNGLTKKEFLKFRPFVQKYCFLQLSGDLLLCAICPAAVTFNIDTLHLIRKHKLNFHPDLPNLDEENEPRNNPKRKMPSEEQKSDLIQNEITKHLDNEGKPLLGCNEEGNLICLVCEELFIPKDYYKYSTNVVRHLKNSARHASALIRKSIPKPSNDGSVTPPHQWEPMQKVTGKHRFINKEVSRRATMALIGAGFSFFSSNSTSTDYLKFKVGQRISCTHLLTKGLIISAEYCIERKRLFYKDKLVWVSIDETQNGTKTLAGLVFGVLDETMASHEIKITVITAKDGDNLRTTVLQALQEYSIRQEHVKLLITDSAYAIRKCGRLLEEAIPGLIHVFCTAHEMHIVCDKIRLLHPVLDSFVGKVKQILARSGPRSVFFKLVTGNCPLPPKPHYIRWGTWIITVNYLYFYLPAVIWFIKQLPFDRPPTTRTTKKKTKKDIDSRLAELKQNVENDDYVAMIQNEVNFIFNYYRKMPKFIYKAEKEKATFDYSNKIVKDVDLYLESATKNTSGKDIEKSKIIYLKWKNCLRENVGLSKLEELCQDKNSFYNYGPLTSAQTERLFAAYRRNFGQNFLRNFGDSNLEKSVICKISIRTEEKTRKNNVKIFDEEYVPKQIQFIEAKDVIGEIQKKFGLNCMKTITQQQRRIERSIAKTGLVKQTRGHKESRILPTKLMPKEKNNELRWHQDKAHDPHQSTRNPSPSENKDNEKESNDSNGADDQRPWSKSEKVNKPGSHVDNSPLVQHSSINASDSGNSSLDIHDLPKDGNQSQKSDKGKVHRRKRSYGANLVGKFQKDKSTSSHPGPFGPGSHAKENGNDWQSEMHTKLPQISRAGRTIKENKKYAN